MYSYKDVIDILMNRDNMTRQEAFDMLKDCRQMVEDGEDPEEVLLNELGLEPDYIFALLG